MGRSPCCDEAGGLTRGHWTPEEDKKLEDYILKHGHGHWKALPKLAGLNRCGKSCRLRWTNYLRPDIKRGPFSEKEEQQIIQLHSVLGNKWSAIAMKLPGRTDNEIKNYWNTHLRKKLLHMGIDPATHRPRADLTLMASIPSLLANLGCGLSVTPLDNAFGLQTDVAQLAKIQLIQSLVQVLSGSCSGSSMSATSSLMGSGFLNYYTPPNDLQNLNQFNGLGESSTPGLHQVPTQTTPASSLSSLGATDADLSHFLQNFSDLPLNSLEGNDMVPQINGSFPINDRFGFENNMSGTRSQMSSPYTNATSNSTPSIVSNSPENFSIDQMQELQNFYSTSSPNVADMCDDIFHWNDGLYQSCSQTWSDAVYKGAQA